jgi:acylphosphatase
VPTCVHAIVRGRVQGVGYRAFVADRAVGHGLTGWVRNRRDGSVEAVFSGAAEAIAAALADCRRGPRLARVEDIETSDVADEAWPDFTVRATA